MATYASIKYDMDLSSSATGAGGMTLLSTQTASSSSTISFTSGIDSTYNEYVFKFYDIHPATDNTYLTFQADTGTNTSYNQTITSTFFKLLHDESDGTTALSYELFGGNSSLYDFTIIFPVVIGSLTVIVIFALVRLFAGTTAGLIASLLFAISLPVIVRGTIGWFKSEPLGIFYALLGLYLFLSAINSKNSKTNRTDICN